MALLEVLERPSLVELRQSQREGTPCHFTLRPAGTQKQFCLDGCVLFLNEYRAQHRLTIIFRESSSGYDLSLSAAVSTENNCSGRVKPLCAPEHIPLLWCGIRSYVHSLLAAADIDTLGDLKMYTEAEICEKLHPSDVAPTQRSKKDAVELFMRLRARLWGIGFDNPCGATDGPATRVALRAAMFS